jgi:hypothetical protein
MTQLRQERLELSGACGFSSNDEDALRNSAAALRRWRRQKRLV